MITAGDFKNGLTFEMDGKVYQVIEFHSRKIHRTRRTYPRTHTQS